MLIFMKMWRHLEGINIKGALWNKYEMEYTVACYSKCVCENRILCKSIAQKGNW